jgi:hypothetical protein
MAFRISDWGAHSLRFAAKAAIKAPLGFRHIPGQVLGGNELVHAYDLPFSSDHALCSVLV